MQMASAGRILMLGEGVNAASSGWFWGGERLGYGRAGRRVSTIHEKEKKDLLVLPLADNWPLVLDDGCIEAGCAGKGLGRGYGAGLC